MSQIYQYPSLITLPGLAMLLLVAGCRKAEDPVINYSGQVNLYTDLGTTVSDASGVEVSLYDRPDIKTQTTSDGRFTLQAPAANEQCLVFKKESYGTYYSDKLTATGHNYALSQPVKLGQWSPVNYYYSVATDKVRKQIVITGTMFSFAGSIAPGRRTHRLFFDPSIEDDGYANVLIHRYSQKRWNNTATGFSDTIAYSLLERLSAGTNQHISMLAVHSDNPVADSCRYPRKSGGWYPKAYSAIGLSGISIPDAGNGPLFFTWWR